MVLAVQCDLDLDDSLEEVFVGGVVEETHSDALNGVVGDVMGDEVYLFVMLE